MILDGVPGQFLTLDKRHIPCINHGTRFRMDDGVCIHARAKASA